MVEPFSHSSVRGFLHRPEKPSGDGLVFTHGAGGNSQSPLLIALADAFAGEGFTVLRCDLPFRQARESGPPRPGDAERDRQGLKQALESIRKLVSRRMFLGGQSYGGRQATILCADEPELADGLLLTSYPLHPPGKPGQLRTQHFPNLLIPALFIQGTKDPFATIDEMTTALRLIPAPTRLMPIEGLGHDLGFRGKTGNHQLKLALLESFRQFFASS